MYAKEESKKIRIKFWTALGNYMKLQKSAEGLPINWINYNTRNKFIAVKMFAESKSTGISLVITHPDEDFRKLIYQQLVEYQSIFEQYVGNDWIWVEDVLDHHGKSISIIQKELPNVNLYNQSDWPEMIRFFKNKIVNLDEFWTVVKESFDDFL